MQHLARQHVADAGDRAGRAAVDEAVKDLRVDADHQRQGGILAGYVLRRIAQRGCAAELLEADKMGMALPQREEQIGAGLVAIVGAVVDHGRQIHRGVEHRLEMRALRRRRRTRATARVE